MILIPFKDYSQNQDKIIRQLFSSIVFLTENRPHIKIIEGKKYEILKKDPVTNTIEPILETFSGTGFFINKGVDIYLVTAAHVAMFKTYSPTIIYNDINNVKRTIKLSASSDIVYLNQRNKNFKNPFFLLDDPSIGGFSGGPVLNIDQSFINNRIYNFLPYTGRPLKIVGLIHGTIKDNLGGFAAIVPSFQILETIDMCPSLSGVHTFYYPNGKIWSKVIYKNGIPNEVLSNFKTDGTQQDKGSLKNGTGTLKIYNEKGRLVIVEKYKNGKFLDSNVVLTEGEIEILKKQIANEYKRIIK
ncbi:toxin-antitoxin system YwqK family antitoxin [Aquimarina algiphila]|uniref:toxin-antitoxin system YwqK family antitoxin n=1 Tax=Aquimarina algiphila TaxID=2047982 RepID=UPI00232B9AC5|nr:hypothetical protein [Aquimarina algiphila]